MPFGNLSSFKGKNGNVNRSSKKVAISSKPHTVAALNKKVDKIAKRDKPEVKRLQWGLLSPPAAPNESTSFQMSTTNPAVIMRQLCPILRGLGQTQRIGSRVKNVKMEYAYDILNTGAVANPAFLRVAIIYDKKPNQALPLMTELFDVNPVFPGVPMSNIQFRNVNYMKRFRFLVNHFLTIGSNGGAPASPAGGNMPNILHRHGSVKLNDIITQYVEGAVVGTFDQITEGAFYLLAWSSVEVPPAAPGNEIGFTGLFRLHYSDA